MNRIVFVSVLKFDVVQKEFEFATSYSSLADAAGVHLPLHCTADTLIGIPLVFHSHSIHSRPNDGYWDSPQARPHFICNSIYCYYAWRSYSILRMALEWRWAIPHAINPCPLAYPHENAPFYRPARTRILHPCMH